MDILDGYHLSRGLSNSDHQYHLMARRRSWLFAFLVREREDKHHQRWFTALILIHYADTWRGTRGPRPRVQSAVMEILFRPQFCLLMKLCFSLDCVPCILSPASWQGTQRTQGGHIMAQRTFRSIIQTMYQVTSGGWGKCIIFVRLTSFFLQGCENNLVICWQKLLPNPLLFVRLTLDATPTITSDLQRELGA